MSPDLNPVENPWSEVSRGLKNKDSPPPANVAELTQAVVEIWRDIPDEQLSTRVLNMPRRLRAVYNARPHEILSIFTFCLA